jgi:hypothetical protein
MSDKKKDTDFEDEMLREIVRGVDLSVEEENPLARVNLNRATWLVSKRGDLTENEMRELDAITQAMQSVGPIGNVEGSFRNTRERIPPNRLRMEAISGDDILSGDEETFMYTQEYYRSPERPRTRAPRIPNARERYYMKEENKQPKIEPVKSTKPPKRKLDI